MIQLTKSAKSFIERLVSIYNDRLSAGMHYELAAEFNDEDFPNCNAEIQELRAIGLVTSDTLGGIYLQRSGIAYVESLSKQQQPQQPITNINIHNSQGINVGDNNTSNININTVDFNEIYKMIDDLNEEHQDEMREIVDILKDCIENSKPLPKGRFQTMLEVTSQMSTIFCNIGQLIFEHLTQ